MLESCSCTTSKHTAPAYTNLVTSGIVASSSLICLLNIIPVLKCARAADSLCI